MLVLGLFLAFSGAARAAFVPPVEQCIEEISQFDSQIRINKDTSLSIVETIDYFTPQQKHGIYRYIPEKLRRNGLIESNPITDISVTAEDGSAMPFTIREDQGNLVIKIGDPEITFAGSRKYKIGYTIARAIHRQNGFDELYWDITGEGWQFPVQKARVTIESPFARPTESKCFTGPVGGTASDCLYGAGKDTFAFNTKPIRYGENFTVALKLDQNNELTFPSRTESFLNMMKDNGSLLLILLPGLVMFLVWYRYGRDRRFLSPNAFNLDPNQPQGLRPLFEPVNIPMVYEPLKDLTPGEAGTMIDEKVDNQDVVAEIIELARKKFLKIERVEKQGFLQFGHDYLFTKLKEATEALPPQQKYLLENIFDSKTEVKMSQLKGSFYIHMTKVKEMMNKQLVERKLLTSSPETARGLSIALAIILNGIVFGITIDSVVFLQAPWPVFLLAVSAITSLFFAWNMPQKTAVGTNLALQVKGLKETIRLGKWREEIKEKHLFIEEVLPFAISLGVIEKLVKDMAELNLVPPKYMSGGFTGNTLAWSGFVNDFSSSATSGLSYNPSSISASRSGFSGGSSGGGGGGGGGGSW